MIEVEILRNKSGRAVGIRSLGHADYADSGYDIICAAVSALELNFANSVRRTSARRKEALTLCSWANVTKTPNFC